MTQTPLYFAISRIARLYPAVIVYVLLSIIILGPYAASVPARTYFQAHPWDNFMNATLWNWRYNLPYVFSDNPLKHVTNRSGWTLPVELRCYFFVLFIEL